MTTPPPVRVFYSYSHADEDLRQELEKHLSLLQRQGIIAGWHDRKILPGSAWEEELDQHLEEAQIVLLLLSADFMASNYCYDREMQRALERHAQGEAQVIPIYLRPVYWASAPFAKLQGLLTDARPVTEWPNRDRAFEDIAVGIHQAAEHIRGTPAPAPIVSMDLATPTRVPWRKWLGASLLLLVLAAAIGAYGSYQDVTHVAPLIAEGQRLLATGQYPRSRRVYEQALAQSWFAKSSARRGMERASVYDAEDGAFHEDVITQRINHLLQQNPHDAYAHLFLGDLQASRDAYQEASALYAQAIAYDPTLAHGYYSLGVVYDKSGAPHKALEMYEQAVQHADSSLLYWNNLAGQYFRLQNYSKAIATYEQTLKRDGDFLLPYFDMAACFRVLGQFEQARQYQQQGVARIDTPQIAAQEKNQQPWYFNLGEQHIALDTLPRKQCYAYRSLGATLQALHRSAEAAQYERKPCALNSVDMEAIQTWVQLEALSMDRVPTKP